MTNVLVTGGCGVVGSRIAERFLEQRGVKVEVLDACEEPRNDWIAERLRSKGATVHRYRIETTGERHVFNRISEFDLVVHAAAWTGIPASAEDPEDDWVSNVDATRCLLRALRAAEKPPFTVALSSVKPYGLGAALFHESHSPAQHRYVWKQSGWRYPNGVSEQWPVDPDEPYAASKLAQSALCLSWARSYGLPVTVFRCSNLYGPAPCHGPRHGWLTWFAISAAIGRPLTVQGRGCQTRDMLHADDVFAAVVAAAAHAPSTAGQLYNLGGGMRNVVSVSEAAAALAEAGGVPVLKAEGRAHEDPIFVTDCSKFTGATGWQPAVDVLEGMWSVHRWAKENAEALRELYKDVG